MIDDSKEYTSADVLTLDDALSLAVLGYKVRAVDMQPGSFIDYQFAGWRINFDSGSSSGWSKRPHDETVDWHVIDDVHVEAYKRAVAESFDEPVGMDLPGVVSKSQAWGRALRPVPPAPPAGLVIGEGATVWGLDRKAAPVAPAAPAEAPPSVGKWGKALPTPAPTKDKWGRSS